MKKIYTFGLYAFLIIFLGVSGLVFAETETSTSTSGSTETSTESKETFDKRQEDRKKALKVALSQTEKTRLKSRCKAAQGKVSSVTKRVKGISTSRSQQYDNIVNHLDSLVEKLKAKGVNTAEFEADIATLKGKMAEFETTLAVYQQDISDLELVDCQADPDAFKAALLAARQSLEEVKEDSQAVKDYIKDVIKPLLASIRQQLEPKEGGN